MRLFYLIIIVVCLFTFWPLALIMGIVAFVSMKLTERKVTSQRNENVIDVEYNIKEVEEESQ
ncbi:MAG: hypothetical protein HUJ57_07385 [Erysipelotrichaceae bacterium]|nr:hypothetical protein [Erysipelotrichaceae bacterium]